jgi:hypothetical protein
MPFIEKPNQRAFWRPATVLSRYLRGSSHPAQDRREDRGWCDLNFRSTGFDQAFIRQLREQLEHITLDNTRRSVVAPTEFRDQVRYPDR